MATNRKVDFLKIATINIDSIRGKHLELVDFAENHDLNVVLVQESWLKGERFSVPNYNVFRNDRLGRVGEGTIILLKKNISAHSVTNPDSCNTIEAPTLKLN